MLVIVLGTVSALLYGVSDFFGGTAARSRSSLQVTLWAFVVSAVVVAPALWSVHSVWSPAAVASGGVAGLLGAVYLWAYYRALAAGPVGVVAPAVALVSAVLPALVGILRGEAVTPTLIVGIGVVVVAGVLLALEPDAHRRPTRATLGLVAIGGVSSTLWFLVVHAAPTDSGIVPLAADTVTGTLALALAVTWLRSRAGPATLREPWAPNRAIIATGLAQGLASVLLVIALHLPALAVVSALAALYPVGTVGLGLLVLHERTRATQLVGLAVAVAGAAVVTIGQP